MTRTLVAAIAASILYAAPAAAQETTATSNFTGFHIGGHIGGAGTKMIDYDGFTYGAEAGYSYQFDRAVVGVTAEIQDVDDSDRDLSIIGRAGGTIGNNALIYVGAGYSNLKAYGIELDGLRILGGVEVAVGRNAFVKVEQRYSNYEFGVDLHQSVVGAGFRF